MRAVKKEWLLGMLCVLSGVMLMVMHPVQAQAGQADRAAYRAVFDACDRHNFVQGFGLWDWNGKLNITPETVCYDGGYGLYLKPSADVVKAYFSRKLG